MKRITTLLVLALATLAVPCFAQQAKEVAKVPVLPREDATKPEAKATEGPQLSAEQKDAIHQKIVQLQSNILKQYQNRDQYNDAQKQLTEQATALNQNIEALIAEAQKTCGNDRVVDRGTLSCVAAPPAKK